MESSFEREIRYVVDTMLAGGGTHEEAISLMNTLRAEAQRLDRKLADPKHIWNSIN